MFTSFSAIKGTKPRRGMCPKIVHVLSQAVIERNILRIVTHCYLCLGDISNLTRQFSLLEDDLRLQVYKVSSLAQTDQERLRYISPVTTEIVLPFSERHQCCPLRDQDPNFRYPSFVSPFPCIYSTGSSGGICSLKKI